MPGQILSRNLDHCVGFLKNFTDEFKMTLLLLTAVKLKPQIVVSGDECGNVRPSLTSARRNQIQSMTRVAVLPVRLRHI